MIKPAEPTRKVVPEPTREVVPRHLTPNDTTLPTGTPQTPKNPKGKTGPSVSGRPGSYPSRTHAGKQRQADKPKIA
jgi:hypothetical protein